MEFNKDEDEEDEDILKAYSTSESSHNYLGDVLFDVSSCTSFLRFNWVVQQVEG
jgi:hypothetical protein